VSEESGATTRAGAESLPAHGTGGNDEGYTNPRREKDLQAQPGPPWNRSKFDPVAVILVLLVDLELLLAILKDLFQIVSVPHLCLGRA